MDHMDLGSDTGASAVEYGLLVVLIAVVIITAVAVLGLDTRDLFATVSF